MEMITEIEWGQVVARLAQLIEIYAIQFSTLVVTPLSGRFCFRILLLLRLRRAISSRKSKPASPGSGIDPNPHLLVTPTPNCS